jgi:hypothetical protein
MSKYKCKKHGILSGDERVVWNSGSPGRWCVHCLNKMMDDYCGKLIIIDSRKGELSNDV